MHTWSRISVAVGYFVTLTLSLSDPCLHAANAIVAENCLEGSDSTEWDVNGAGDEALQGYPRPFSVEPGEKIEFFVKAKDNYRIDIFRSGYYQGKGARLVNHLGVVQANEQPACLYEESTRSTDCGNWKVSADWLLPLNSTSGVYFARLVSENQDQGENWRTDFSAFGFDPMFDSKYQLPQAGPHSYGVQGYGRLRNRLREARASHIYFVVRNNAQQHADIIMQTADTTWQAYNTYGGTSLYGSFDPAKPLLRSLKASYNRPLSTRSVRAVNAYFHAEYPMVRFLESHGFSVAYISGLDTETWNFAGKKNKLFLSVGHDEYWSKEQRKSVERARDEGVHLAFFSGNEMYWQVRWEADSFGREGRVMVAYKETIEGKKIDPMGNAWTGTFRDPSEENPQGANPENSVTGQIYTVDTWRNDPLAVPAKFSQLRFWRNTSVSNLKPPNEAMFLRGLLGHEFDEDIDNGFRPAGLFHLSETYVDNVFYLMDQGRQYDSGSSLHTLTLYRHPTSKALVFGAGTVQLTWALDAHHDSPNGLPAHLSNPCNTRVAVDPMAPVVDLQQAILNLFADMDVQPTSVSLPLQRAFASQDRTPPVSWLKDLPEGSGDCLRVEGGVSDEGGVPSGVEVQFQGGRWHPAELHVEEKRNFTWSIEARVTGSGSVLLHSRAVDDSGNLEEGQPFTSAHAQRIACEPLPFRPRPFVQLNSQHSEF